MRRLNLATGMIFALLLMVTASAHAEGDARKVRVGVYDNRAITMAFFDSDLNPFITKRNERHEAEAAGDSARVAELDEWVGKFQCKLHYQGFCRAPVDDILTLVKDRLPEVAKSAGVDFIGWYPDFVGDHVETVDITAELAALFNPSEQRRKQIESLKNIDPTPLCDIAHSQ